MNKSIKKDQINLPHSPTTIISLNMICVWKEGASADASQPYFPELAATTEVSSTWLAFDRVCCKDRIGEPQSYWNIAPHKSKAHSHPHSFRRLWKLSWPDSPSTCICRTPCVPCTTWSSTARRLAYRSGRPGAHCHRHGRPREHLPRRFGCRGHGLQKGTRTVKKRNESQWMEHKKFICCRGIDRTGMCLI